MNNYENSKLNALANIMSEANAILAKLTSVNANKNAKATNSTENEAVHEVKGELNARETEKVLEDYERVELNPAFYEKVEYDATLSEKFRCFTKKEIVNGKLVETPIWQRKPVMKRVQKPIHLREISPSWQECYDSMYYREEGLSDAEKFDNAFYDTHYFCPKREVYLNGNGIFKLPFEWLAISIARKWIDNRLHLPKNFRDYAYMEEWREIVTATLFECLYNHEPYVAFRTLAFNNLDGWFEKRANLKNAVREEIFDADYKSWLTMAMFNNTTPKASDDESENSRILCELELNEDFRPDFDALRRENAIDEFLGTLQLAQKIFARIREKHQYLRTETWFAFYTYSLQMANDKSINAIFASNIAKAVAPRKDDTPTKVKSRVKAEMTACRKILWSYNAKVKHYFCEAFYEVFSEALANTESVDLEELLHLVKYGARVADYITRNDND